jgi:UDP-N-acetyl-D-glucosamine dehydrogenase
MDPHAPTVEEHGLTMNSVDPASSFEPYDAVVITTDHTALDRERLLREARLVVDTRDSMRNVPGDRSKVHGL